MLHNSDNNSPQNSREPDSTTLVKNNFDKSVSSSKSAAEPENQVRKVESNDLTKEQLSPSLQSLEKVNKSSAKHLKESETTYQQLLSDLKDIRQATVQSVDFLQQSSPELALKRLALTMPTSLQAILYPVLTGQFLNSLGTGNLAVGTAAAALIMVPNLMNYLQAKKNHVAIKLSERIFYDEFTEFVSQVQKLSFAALADGKCQEKVEEVRSNRGRVKNFIDGLYNSIDSTMAVSGALVAMSFVNVYVAGAVALGVIPVLALEWKNAALVKKIEDRLAKFHKELWPVSWATTDKEIAAEIKVHRKGNWVKEKVATLGDKIIRRKGILFNSQYLISKAGVAVNSVVNGVAGGWALYQAASGAISAGDAVQFLGSLGALQFTLGAAAKLTGELKTDSYFVRMLFGLGSLEPEGVNTQKSYSQTEISKFRDKLEQSDIDVVFKNVKVEVDTDNGKKNILDTGLLTVPFGKMLGVVGKKGAGKTTFLSTMLGTLKPSSGEVYLHLKDPKSEQTEVHGLHDIPLEAWHSHIGYTAQTAYAGYNLSVWSSIMLGTDENDKNPFSAREAMDLCGASEFIDPDKVKKIVFSYEQGENRQRFSGGEQRGIINTRALIGNRKFLVLDEPTSGQDSINEKRLAENLAQFKGSKTQLIVSHSFGALKFADLIVEVEDGIPRIGTHSELLKRDGIYSKLRAAQLSGLDLDF